MLRPSVVALAGIALGLASLSANAVTIFFNPAASTVSLGDQVSVDVVIEDLGDLSSPSLSLFDLDILFDDSLLGVANVTFGDGLNLGDPLDSIQGDFGLPGGHDVFEISLLSDSALDANQPGSFTLFTLTFDTLATGTSALTIDVQDLGGTAGSGFIVADLRSGSIMVEDASTPRVPEPVPLALLASGLLALGAGRLRRAR